MDAVEFKKAIQRLCIDRGCNECVLFDEAVNDCINSIWGREAEAVAIVEKWSKEHPIMTNAMKFEEVFGVPPIGCFGTYLSLPTGGKTDCKDCLYNTDGAEDCCIRWWAEPYKGGE